MRLVSFEVQRYRNVLDSGVVEVAQDVTCLVGKNEAGKTALLHAIERLNPARPASFNVEDEYPRWRLIPDRKRGLVDEAVPISAVFELEPADRAALEALVGEGVVTEGQVRVTKGYDNVPEWTISIDEQRAVNNLLDHIAIEKADRDALATDSFANLLESVAAARTAADAAAESAAGSEEAEEPSEPAHLSAIEQAVQELTRPGAHAR